MSLFICKVHEIDGEKYDMVINFEIDTYYKGYAGDYYNPPEPAEYEFSIISIEFDPADMPVPENVKDELEAWFFSREGQEYAYEAAEEDASYRDDYED